jgi:predicted nucleic acid-binding protein
MSATDDECNELSLVVDASVAVRWFFQIAGTERANAILRSGEPIIAPDLVIVEIANAAWKAASFDNSPPDAAKAVVREATRFFSELVPSIVLRDHALAIALELRHPVYDCFYLALAQARGITLVTADDRLLGRCAKTPFAPLVRSL